MNNATQKGQGGKKITYLDSIINNSVFPEFKTAGRPQWPEFVFKSFVAEAATKCLELKRKYDFLGQSITGEKALEIGLMEGYCIDSEPENKIFEGQEGWFGKLPETGTFIIWINPDLSAEDGQDIIIYGLAKAQTWNEVYKDAPEFKNLDELAEIGGELIMAVFLTECLRCMLLANENEEELIALQSIKKAEKFTEVKKESEPFTDDREINVLGIFLESLLRSKLLPRRLYEVITDEINTVFTDPVDLTNRENIIPNLKLMLEKERETQPQEKVSLVLKPARSRTKTKQKVAA